MADTINLDLAACSNELNVVWISWHQNDVVYLHGFTDAVASRSFLVACNKSDVKRKAEYR